jgi:hypothetical protein
MHHHHHDFSTQAFLIEFERRLALPVERKIRIHLHGAFLCWLMTVVRPGSVAFNVQGGPFDPPDVAAYFPLD